MRPDNMPRLVAPEHSEPANWIVETLRSQALEIAREGHKGWGNTMTMAADEIERLRGEVERLEAEKVSASGWAGTPALRAEGIASLAKVGESAWHERAEKAESALAELRKIAERLAAYADSHHDGDTTTRMMMDAWERVRLVGEA